jgi:hypothetical protein
LVPWPKWGGGSTYLAIGVVQPPPKGQKCLPTRMGLGFWGARPPLRAWPAWGWPKPPLPKSPNPFPCNFFWPFKGGQITFLAMGVIPPPPDRPWGWLAPWSKWGGLATPFWLRRWLEPPRFSSFFFIFYFAFHFLKKLMSKTMSFWVEWML